MVRVTGGVYANGGGGGAGYAGAEGQAGSDATASLTPAGGASAANGAGAGGTGAIATQNANPGLHPPTSGDTAGGGGGGLGFFQSYTPSGVSPDLSPTEASPGFQPNGVVSAR